MFDGILYQWLEQHAWYKFFECIGIQIFDEGDLVAEPGLLDMHVAAHHHDLLFQFHHLVLVLQVVPEESGEVVDELFGLERLLDLGYGRDGVEGIKQEVRIDLRLKQGQFRFPQETLALLIDQLLAFQLFLDLCLLPDPLDEPFDAPSHMVEGVYEHRDLVIRMHRLDSCLEVTFTELQHGECQGMDRSGDR